MRRALACLLACGAVIGSARAEGVTAPSACRPGSEPMARVELYFGAAGSRRDWARFLAHVVTPRFPDGLTSLEAYGQWRGPRGLAREATHVLIIFYRSSPASDARIEAIRKAYERRFRQVSVLRADSQACVGF